MQQLLKGKKTNFVQAPWGRWFAVAGGDKLSMIRELREKSGSPIAEVKAALDEADYNLETAYQVLRKKGLAAASKKASRRAAEGLIGFAREGNTGVLVEVNSETDFVAGNDQFRSLVLTCANIAARSGNNHASGLSGPQEIDAEELSHQSLDQQSLEARVSDVAGSVRENIRLRRAYRLSAPNGIVSSYLHISPAKGLGRIGTLVALEGTQSPIAEAHLEEVKEIGSKLAMHAAATSPLALDQESLPASALQEEEAILRAQLEKNRKPPNIIEKIVQGRMSKFYEEKCFLDQHFVVDETKTIRDVLKGLSKRIKSPVHLTGFIRLQVGEGLEKDTKTDFASEVHQTLQQTA